jgi:hypothetical protein
MVRLLILFLIGSTFFTASSFAQKTKKANKKETVTETKEPLAFSETQYDFGSIPQGKPATHVFVLENNGLDTLRIENVQTSCGCTTPDYTRDPVLKGSKTQIKVGYNAASEGNFEKSITVTYNGGLSKQLIIKGNVWKTPDQSIPVNQSLKIFQ